MIWEYKRVSLSNTDAQGHLNKLGTEEWELVGFEFGMAYFKRPLPTVEQAPPPVEPASQPKAAVPSKRGLPS